MNQNPKLPKNEHSTIYPLGYSESIKVYESKPNVDVWNAFNSGDEIAFNYIYRMYVTVLFKYGCQMCKNQYHIQDCIQNIFIDLRRKRGQLNEVQSIKAYLFNIAMLMYAEVLNELGNSSTAATYVNFVRARPSVNMPAISNNLNYDQMFEAIRHERRVEFSFEGKVSFDLRRWGIAGKFLRSSDRWHNNIKINPQWGGNFFKFKDGKHEVFPIPQAEIDKSGGTLIQNSNW